MVLIRTAPHFQIIGRSFMIFFIITIFNIFTWKNLTYSSNYTEHVAALMLYLVLAFYTLRHVLSEVIEIVPPYLSVT